MSNLHKNLVDAQIHVPKGFATAANDTKLTKNSTGVLEWAADSGGGGGVSSIVAGTGITISPVTGLGDVTINTSASIDNFVTQNIKAYGSIATGSEFGLGNAQYNSEHKFVTNLGTPSITTITPKNMLYTSVYSNPNNGGILKNWNGWINGATGTIVVLSLLRTTLVCPLSGAYPSTIPVCRAATISLTLTSNNTPICFNIDSFTTCAGFTEALSPNEVLIVTAYSGSAESAVFILNSNITLNF